MDLIPEEEEITPAKSTKTHTILNLELVIFVDHPRHPHATKAAAKGAVIALVIPAANKPSAKKYFENLPNNGDPKRLARFSLQ